eukprot:TRINITY_DN13947_c0_g1_i1.p1 TRINITY_DN13947_c0_g1~~TRINITY_DN13947_c0_g1_i1.p1  ORF type:complete len:422 (-),score=52.96 TRINITY_DN13947_c0_g1_i1:80-1300(-)
MVDRSGEEEQRDAAALEAEEEDKERLHFMDVCYSIADYERSSLQVVEGYGHRLAAALADPHDAALWGGGNADWMLDEMRKRVLVNQKGLLDTLVKDLADSAVGPPSGLGDLTPPPGILRVPDSHQVGSGNESKTRSTLRQFVRDWSREGLAEREACYTPLLDALGRYVPLATTKGKGRRLPRVLTPGSGLGRLTFDAARNGYFAEGNEFSYHMLIGTLFVLNEVEMPFQFNIFPYVLDTAERNGVCDHLAAVQIPDICPCHWCDPSTGFGQISMRGGEFVENYVKQVGEWDAVLTAFFLDTANNVFMYIRTLATIVRTGGLWANLGPLLWHYCPEAGADTGAVSIELSWEEIKPAIEKYFDIRELDCRRALYTASGRASKRKVYNCVFFAAVRNTTPTEGVSHPVH